MASATSAVTLLSGLYGLQLESPTVDGASIDSEQNDHDVTQNWPSFTSLLTTVASCGLRQYDQGLFLEGLRISHLGEGLDYKVDLCEDASKKELVIVKHVKLMLPATESREEVESPIIRRFRKVQTEIRIMAHPPLLKSKYILDLLGYGWEFAEQAYMSPFLVVGYACHGTLRDFLRLTTRQDVAQKQDLTEDIAQGLYALHHCEIVHGDVKMENVLVCEHESGTICAKIADFGSSIIGAAESSNIEYYGTAEYHAPELRASATLKSDETRSSTLDRAYLLDVYAYGLLIWEILLDGARFFHRPGVDLAIERGDYDVVRELALKDCYSTVAGRVEATTFNKLIENILQVDTDHRWNTSSILKNIRKLENESTPGQTIVFSPLQPFKTLPSGLDMDDSPMEISNLLHTGEILDDNDSGEKLRLPPWDLQKAIASGLMHQVTHKSSKIVGKSALHLAICYFLGFGVERDIDQMLHCMRMAAEAGVMCACNIVERLHAGFSRPYSLDFEAIQNSYRKEQASIVTEALDAVDHEKRAIIALDALGDADDQEQISIVIKSMKAESYTTPWHAIDMVSQRRVLTGMASQPALGIHQLAYLGMVDELTVQLKSGTKDYEDEEGRTAIYMACWGGYLDAIKALLSHGSDASIADGDGYTPLHFLVMLPESDVEEAVQLIMNSSANVDINAFTSEPLVLPEGWMEIVGAPIHWAIASHNISMIRALLNHGVDILTWEIGNSPIHLAASLHYHDVLELLLDKENGFSVNLVKHMESPLFCLDTSDPVWRTVIHGKNWKEAISHTIDVLARHWDINELLEPEMGLTPLTQIASHNKSEADIEIAACLLKKCNPETRPRIFSALQFGIIGLRDAHLSSHANIVHLMLDAGCSSRTESSASQYTDTRFKPGWNSLHWAVNQGNVSVCRHILQREPDLVHVPTNDEFGDPPLHLATSGGTAEIIDLLLDCGADPATESKKFSLTVLGFYLSDQRTEPNMSILGKLLQISEPNNYIVFSREQERWTFLHYLSVRASLLNLEGVQGQWLLQKVLSEYPHIKVLLDTRTKFGWTALHLAAYNVGYSTARILLEASADSLLETPGNSARAFDIVMERGRHSPPESVRGSRSSIEARWLDLAYKTMKILLKYMEKNDLFFELSKLHLAAYIGYHKKVVRLIEKGADPKAESDGMTPAELLRSSLGGRVDEKFQRRATHVLEYLDGL